MQAGRLMIRELSCILAFLLCCIHNFKVVDILGHPTLYVYLSKWFASRWHRLRRGKNLNSKSKSPSCAHTDRIPVLRLSLSAQRATLSALYFTLNFFIFILVSFQCSFRNVLPRQTDCICMKVWPILKFQSNV